MKVGGRPRRELTRGGELTIGRHLTNDLMVDGDNVSRFHARLDWPAEAERPRVIDLDSLNGTCLDSERLIPHRPRTCRNEARICLGGEVTLTVEIFEPVQEEVAILMTGTENVKNVFDVGGAQAGVISSPSALMDLLLDLEHFQRTGVLLLHQPDALGVTRLYFGGGRILLAEWGPARGIIAITALLKTIEPGIPFVFSPDFVPQEAEELLDIKPSSLRVEQNSRETGRVPRPDLAEAPATKPRGVSRARA